MKWKQTFTYITIQYTQRIIYVSTIHWIYKKKFDVNSFCLCNLSEQIDEIQMFEIKKWRKQI